MTDEKDDPRTDVEIPHVLETASVVATTENPRHIIRKGDGVGAKAVSGEPTPDGGPAPIHHGRRRGLNVHHIRHMGDGAKAEGRLFDRGCTGRLGGGLARGSGERGRTCVHVWAGHGEVAGGGSARRGVTRSRAART